MNDHIAPSSGLTMHCPACGSGFHVAALTPGEIQCPTCAHRMNLNIDRGGQTVITFGSLAPPANSVAQSGDNSAATLTDIAGATREGVPEHVAAKKAPSTDDVPLVPGMEIGGFLLEEELGRGGMGVVFRATQKSLGRQVAIKVLPARLAGSPDFVRRFNREAKALAALQHPNIVGILDKGEENGLYYFVMEYVDGVNLRQVLAHGGLNAGDALRYIPPLCDALGYAHEMGIVHRDIKPENILIDKRGNVKIADFGLSKIVAPDQTVSRITNTMVVMGTPDYMAPEQRLSSKDVDHRADLYSLGVVIYEMLTGDLPLGSNFPPPSIRNRDVFPSLDPVVLRVLESDPSRRYQQASDLATAIADAQKPGAAHSPAVSPPPVSPAPIPGLHTPMPPATSGDACGTTAPCGPPHPMHAWIERKHKMKWFIIGLVMSAIFFNPLVPVFLILLLVTALTNPHTRGPKYRGQHLPGANFANQTLRGADFSGAKLSGAVFIGASLDETDFSDADLSGAQLADATLRDADLSDAKLVGANLRGANLSEADLSEANLEGAILAGAKLTDAEFEDARLVGADLRHANLKNADLTGANLTGADVRGANFSGANLKNAILDEARVDGAIFEDAKLKNVRLPVGVDISKRDGRPHLVVPAGGIDGGSPLTANPSPAGMPQPMPATPGTATIAIAASATADADGDAPGKTWLVWVAFVLAFLDLALIGHSILNRSRLLEPLFAQPIERMVEIADWVWWLGLVVNVGLILIGFAALNQRRTPKIIAITSLVVILPGFFYWNDYWDQLSSEISYWQAIEDDLTAHPTGGALKKLQTLALNPTERPSLPQTITRRRAVWLLVQAPADSARDMVRGFLTASDEKLRLETAELVGAEHATHFAVSLAKLTADGDLEVAKAAVDALAQPPFAAAGAELLAHAFEGANAAVKPYLVEKLAKLAEPVVLPDLVVWSAHANAEVATAAKIGIARYRSPLAVPHIANLLGDPNRHVRLPALVALRRYPIEMVAGVWVAALASEYRDVREDAIAELRGDTKSAFAYSADNPEANAVALVKWQEWLAARQSPTIKRLDGMRAEIVKAMDAGLKLATEAEIFAANADAAAFREKAVAAAKLLHEARALHARAELLHWQKIGPPASAQTPGSTIAAPLPAISVPDIQPVDAALGRLRAHWQKHCDSQPPMAELPTIAPVFQSAESATTTLAQWLSAAIQP